ncbi:restriction endonuclease subunit S [Pedobacter frigoris]|uniref:Restriction endonuclease subunit S n=1 Tax=Pedobacter frigoris TaxID=2571272 RepID=A0A4U1CHU4_9SPHI|nr:restriction endonuclease subunit S [Pedobacter frigoris]TKC04865.1 restriction endonuclease subunit S [Pedobacter frigoris]
MMSEKKSQVTSKGWTEVNLLELLLSLESGSRPIGGVKNIKDGIPSIGAEHLNSKGGFKFQNIKFISKEFSRKMINGKVSVDDILIVKDGATTGKIAIVEKNFPFDEAYINEHVFICRPSKFVIPKYLFWFLWSQAGQSRILKNFKGSAQGGINASFAKNTLIPVAPYNEQKRIISIIENLNKTLVNFEIKHCEIQELITKAFRKFTSNEKGELTTRKIGSFCSEQRIPIGKNWHDKRLIGVSNESGITNLRIGGKTTFEKYKVVNPGDFIYNPMRVDIGSIAIWEGQDVALTSPDYIVFKINHTISPILLLKYLKSPLGLSEIKNNTQGSVRSRLYFDNLAKIDFPFLSENQQIEAQIVLETLEKVKIESENIIFQMQSVFHKMLQKAYLGQLKTNNTKDEEVDVLLNKIKLEIAEYSINRLENNKLQRKIMTRMKTNGKTIMEILSEAGKPMLVKHLWEESVHAKDIDGFYATLKILIEIEKKVVEIREGNDYYINLHNEN